MEGRHGRKRGKTVCVPTLLFYAWLKKLLMASSHAKEGKRQLLVAGCKENEKKKKVWSACRSVAESLIKQIEFDCNRTLQEYGKY